MIKDINDRSLHVGDEVYFTIYGDDTIRQDIVSKIDNKNIFIGYKNYLGKPTTCRMGHHRANHRIVRI